MSGDGYELLSELRQTDNRHVQFLLKLRYAAEGMMFVIDSVIACDEAKDVAILKTTAKTDLAPLPLGDSESLEKGEKVVAIGSPLGFMNTVSTGIFSAYNQLQDMVEIQFSASISSGSSGGALFNTNGEVIGITYASYTDGQNLNAAVPISYAADLWASKDAAAPLSLSELYDSREHIETYSASILWDKEIAFDLGTELFIDGLVVYKHHFSSDYTGPSPYELVVFDETSQMPNFTDTVSVYTAALYHAVPSQNLHISADDSDLYDIVSVGDHIIAKCIVGKDESGNKIYNIESIEIIPD